MKYNNLLNQCNSKIVLQDKYTPDCMQKRNEYLINYADCVIAVWDGRASGTGKTVQLAKYKQIPITVLNPRTMQVSYM